MFKLIDFIEVIHTEEKILSRDRPGESEIVLSFFSDDFFLEETEDEHDKRIEEFIQYMIENCSNDYEKRIYGCYLLDIGMCYWDISFEGGNIIEAKNFEGKTLNLLNDSDSINSTIGRTLLSTVSLAIMDTVNNCSKEKNITISEYFELNKDIYEFFCDSINKSMERKNQSSVLLCSEVDILREDEDYEWNDDLNRKDLVERERKEKIELDERVKNAYNSMKR